ncbi:MAG: hypothetical protein AAF531_06660 [Actinomycetota bacterium]
MTSPSAAQGPDVSDPEDQDRSEPSGEAAEDLASVDEGVALLARYDAMVDELLAGLGDLRMPGR